jgi:hypothetical protein
MKCRYCTKEIRDDAITCKYCGRAVMRPKPISGIAGGAIQKTPHSPDDVEGSESQTRSASNRVAGTLGIIFGAMLLTFACLALVMILFAPSEYERPFHPSYELDNAASIGIVAAIASALIAAGIPLILRGRVSIMYCTNAFFLFLVSLYAHPWSVFADTGHFHLRDLMAAFPCLGTLVFGVLLAREVQRRNTAPTLKGMRIISLTGLRIVSWTPIVVGGLGTYLILAGLAKSFIPSITSFIALGASIVGGLLAGTIPLVLGRSRISVMYIVNAVLLAVTTLCVYMLSLWDFLGFYHGFHIGHLTLPGLFVLLPSLGAVLFGILYARQTQRRGLRIISWICVGIGGLGMILFVGLAVVWLFT